jgi:hypothetical protein
MTVKEYLEEKLEGVKATVEQAAKMYALSKVIYEPHHALGEIPKETYVVNEGCK